MGYPNIPGELHGYGTVIGTGNAVGVGHVGCSVGIKSI